MVIVGGCLGFSALPVLASGTCAVTCSQGTPPVATTLPLVIAASPDACRTRCPTACPAGATCSTPVYVDGATLPVVAPPVATPHAATPSVSPPTNANRAAVPITLSQPIGGVRVVVDVGNYIAVVYSYVIGLAGTAAVVMIVYGGFLYLLGSATSDVGKGKQIIQDAIIGLLLVLGAYTILATVNPNTLNLKMPDLKKIEPKALPVAQAPETHALAAQNDTTVQIVATGESCTSATSCTCNQEMCTRFFGHPVGETPTRPWVCATPPAECIDGACRIRCQLQPTAQDQQHAVQAAQIPLTRCALDTTEFGCPTGQTCMRTEITVNSTGILLIARDRAARQGYCSDGRNGSRCRCSAQGCHLTESGIVIDGRLATLFPGRTDVSTVRALQPTNNGWMGSQPCQTGLQCIPEGTDWFCRPTAGTVPTPAPGTSAPTPTP